MQNNSRNYEFGPVSVKVPRLPLKDFECCPGCSCIFNNPEQCARHLIGSCLHINHNETKDSRRNFIKWLLNYYENCSCTSEISLNSSKINRILNDCSFSGVKKARVEVILHEIPVCMRCPVCNAYFYSATSCSDHLFRVCLYTESSDDARSVQEWLTNFFNSNKQHKHFIKRMLLENWSAVSCKYEHCNFVASNHDDLIQHCKLEHYDSVHLDLEQYVCYVCNTSSFNGEMFIKHLVRKHIRCYCGISKPDLASFRSHVQFCKFNPTMEIRCPMCAEFVSMYSDCVFEAHIFQCKRIDEKIIDTNDFYTNCDICFKTVFIPDVYTHLIQHLGNGDQCSTRQKRVTVSLKEIQNYISEKKFTELSTQ